MNFPAFPCIPSDHPHRVALNVLRVDYMRMSDAARAMRAMNDAETATALEVHTLEVLRSATIFLAQTH